MNFWDLHGPAEFVSQIEEELRANRAAVVAFPEHGPSGFCEKLGTRLDRQGWHHLVLPWREGDNPLAFLFRELQVPLQHTERQSVLLFVSRLGQMVITINEIGPADWPAWKRFLIEYERELRVRHEGNAPLILCVLAGIEIEDAKVHASAISLHPWSDVVSELDTLTFIRAQFLRADRHGLEGEISRRIVARLALWDVDSVAELMRLSINELTYPTEILKQFAQMRRWESGGKCSWSSGAMNVIDGRTMPHSAWLSVNNANGELDTRIWSAQAAIALPLVEQRRRELAPRGARYLRFPLEIDGEQVFNVIDLQIGPLCHLLSLAGCRDRDLMRKLRSLKNVRNALAHVKVVDPTLLLDAEFLSN